MATTRDKHDIIISAKDRASRQINKVNVGMGGIAKSALLVGAAYKVWQASTEFIESAISDAAKYEATLISLNMVAVNTGRDVNKIYEEMGKHLGGLASKASVASGFLKGMTTSLSTEQVSKMTKAIREASLAMGEDFNVQLPLIIKGLKQLNPAILDNIGVNVRLDVINRKITQGYYGLNTVVSEATQQQAIYTEILKQTAKFQGVEAAFLKTTQGRIEKITVAWQDLKVAAGDVALGLDEGDVTILDAINGALRGIGAYIGDLSHILSTGGATFGAYWTLASENLDNFLKLLGHAGDALKAFLTGDFDQLSLAIAMGVGRANIATDEFKTNLEALQDAALATADAVSSALANAVAVGVAAAKEQTKTEAEESLSREERLMQELFRKNVMYQEFHIRHIKLNQKATEEDTYLQDLVREHEAASLAARSEEYQRFSRYAAGVMGSTSDSIIRQFRKGKIVMREVWQDMAEDFLKYFARQVLKDIAKYLIPGIIRLLSSIFDTAANDRMAMKQGADFARFFKRGAMDGMQGFSPAFAGAAVSGGYSGGAMANGGSGLNLTINISGDADESVLNRIIPGIEMAAENLTSKIALSPDMITGGALRVV